MVEACVNDVARNALVAYTYDCAALGYFPDDKLVQFSVPQITTTTAVGTVSVSPTPSNGVGDRFSVWRGSLVGLGLLFM